MKQLKLAALAIAISGCAAEPIAHCTDSESCAALWHSVTYWVENNNVAGKVTARSLKGIYRGNGCDMLIRAKLKNNQLTSEFGQSPSHNAPGIHVSCSSRALDTARQDFSAAVTKDFRQATGTPP